MIDLQVANSIIPYVKKLYETNKLFIKVAGVNFYNIDAGTDSIIEINHNISQLIPYSYDNSNNTLKISKRDGLLEYTDKFDYLFKEYEIILNTHYNTLNDIRIIRNKYEHELHNIIFSNSMWDESSCSFFCVFKIGEKTVKIDSQNLISLLKDLNKLFSKLVFDIKKYAEENEKNDCEIYSRIARFSFIDFNTIYESNFLHIIGKVQFDF